MTKTNDAEQLLSGNARVDGFYHTVEWLITAFAGTLVFIFFVMQVYRIPTGSMAETLRGAHFRLRCQQCGYRYDYDFAQQAYKHHFGIPENVTPNRDMPILPAPPRCPSCGFHEPQLTQRAGKVYIDRGGDVRPGLLRTVFKGDQIFVLKSIYQFFEPKRWDVIVFKNPVEPKINYIKRLIAKPGETLQIIDGDIYIDGHIARKPAHVQEELWMVVYDNDYQPTAPGERGFNGGAWRQPFENRPDSRWQTAADGPSVFALDSGDDIVHRLRYNTAVGNDFRATYGYNDPRWHSQMPICSDLMVRCRMTLGAAGSAFGVRLTKYGVAYEGWAHADGRLEIVRVNENDGTAELVAQGRTAATARQQHFRFFNADHVLRLEVGDAQIAFDLGTLPDAAGDQRQIPPTVELAGSGAVRLRQIGLFRDIHYLDGVRATAKEPLTLGEDAFFACGDNSPFSYDSRLWKDEGIGNRGGKYPTGIVPREYLVGKAVFVHWPGGWRIGSEPLRWIPAPDGMKFIYGGK